MFEILNFYDNNLKTLIKVGEQYCMFLKFMTNFEIKISSRVYYFLV